VNRETYNLAAGDEIRIAAFGTASVIVYTSEPDHTNSKLVDAVKVRDEEIYQLKQRIVKLEQDSEALDIIKDIFKGKDIIVNNG
jgi:hypothetical protein